MNFNFHVSYTKKDEMVDCKSPVLMFLEIYIIYIMDRCVGYIWSYIDHIIITYNYMINVWSYISYILINIIIYIIYIYSRKNLESNLRLPRIFWESVIGEIEIWSFAMSSIIMSKNVCSIWVFNIWYVVIELNWFLK